MNICDKFLRNFKVLFNFLAIVTLSGCAEILSGPYYPAPFANFEYSDARDDNQRKKDEPIQNSRPTKFSPLYAGAVGFKQNPIVDVSSISRYRKIQDQYIREFAAMSSTFKFSFDPATNTVTDLYNSNYTNTKTAKKAVFVVNVANSNGRENEIVFGTSWSEVAKNGFNYVDGVCNDYLRQVYRLQKNTQGLKTLTINSGYALAEVLSLTLGASANPSRVLGILASAFGLGAGVFDIYRESILYKADFSAVLRLVKSLHKQQRDGISSEINTRSQAVGAIQSYLFACTPHTLEAAINTKIGSEMSPAIAASLGILDFADRNTEKQEELKKELAIIIDKYTAKLKKE